MTPVLKMLEGEVEDPQTREVDALRAQCDDLTLQLRQACRERDDAKIKMDRTREDAQRALSMLRQQLNPLYRALQAVFGELDAAGMTEPSADGSHTASVPLDYTDPRLKAVWESWKSRLPPACGKVIDALLVHGALNSVQIKVAARLGTSTVSDSIYKLNKAGLIDKNGGRFSLKAL